MWWSWGEKPKRKQKNQPLRYPITVYTYPKPKLRFNFFRFFVGLGIGLFMLYQGVSQDAYMEQLRTSGVLVSGVITDKTVERGRYSPHYYLHFTYTPDGTTMFNGTGTTNYQGYQETNIGDSIRVVYLPDDPQSYATEDHVNRRLPTTHFYGVLGLAIALILAFVPLGEQR